MFNREAYKLKMQGELDLVMAKILEYRGIAKIAAGKAREEATNMVDDLQTRFDKTKSKLAELGDTSENAWESVKDGVETAWEDLRTAFGEAKDRFKK